MNTEKFVNRVKELTRLTSNLEKVRKGEGRIVLIEGAAGVGKTALARKFLSQVKDAEILSARATTDTRFTPYHLFTQALKNYGDLHSIKIEQERRKIEDLSQDFVVRPRMIFVDEIENGAGLFLFNNLTEELPGIHVAVKMPERNHNLWLTEVKTDIPRASPTNIEFDILPKIYDLAGNQKMNVIFIEDINYLIYANGIDRVVEFLHSLYSFASGKNIVIVSGHSEHLDDDEKSKLFSCFDEIVSLDIHYERGTKTLFFVSSIDDVNSQNQVIFTSRKGIKGKIIGEPPLTPHRLDFEIYESVIQEIEKGKDVILDCIPYLIHYHGVRKIYIWLKSIADFAAVKGRRIYVVTTGLSEHHIDVLKNIVDVSNIEKKTSYEELDETSAIKFYDYILGFLEYNSKKVMEVIFLEDLQWADKSSLELLLYLARNIGRSRIFIIATYRGHDLVSDEEASELIENIQNLDTADLIRLRNLTKDCVHELLKSVNPEISEDDVEYIFEKSEGNPLLALTILEQIDKVDIRVPETIRESVEIQLENLDDRTLHFLTYLSVIGDMVPTYILDKVYPRWRERIKKVEGKFVKLEDDHVEFTYSIYREIIYKLAPKDTRMDIHREIAEIYEKMGDVVRAANNYYFAGDVRALKLLKKAAEASIRDLAIRDAVDYCKMALDIAKKYRLKEEIIQIYERTGDYYRMTGEYQKAIEMYESTLSAGNPNTVSVGTKIGECYERLGNYDKAYVILQKYLQIAKGLEKGRITGKIGIIKWHIGEFEEARTYLEEYLKVAKKYNSLEDEAEAYRNIAIIFYYYSKYDEALKYAKKALSKAIESGKYDIIANSYNVIGVIYNHKHMIDEALEYFKKYLDIAEKMGNYDYISKAYNNLALIYDYKGNFALAKSYYLRSLEMNFKLGNKRDLSISYNNVAVIESEYGDSMKAIEYLKKSLKYAEEIGDTYNLCGAYINLGSFYMQIRYYEEAIDSLKSAIKIAEREDYFSSLVGSYSLMIKIHVELGKINEAKKYLKLAEKYVGKSEDIYDRLTFFETKIDYLIAANRINEAEDLLEDSIKIAMELKDDNELNILDEYRARIRCVRGDYNTAEIYFERVIEYLKSKNRKKQLAEAYRYYAECLENYRKYDAKKYYQLSHTLYKSLNNQRWAEEIEKKLENFK